MGPNDRSEYPSAPADHPPGQPARAEGTNGAVTPDPLQLRDEFFRQAIDPAQWFQPFERLAGVHYFVKDAQGRMMAVSPDALGGLGFTSPEQIVGKTDYDLSPPELADKYLADDRRVMRTGRPLRNIVEIGFHDTGIRDWVVTDKYPLRDTAGRVVGVVGIWQSLQGRRQQLAHLGPVGQAADFIRDHLGEDLSLARVADHVALSERQLGRLFRRLFGTSVRQFIILSRVHTATRELTLTDKSIAQVARSLGFHDQSAFSNTFRRVIGTTPREYRDRHVSRLTS